MTQSMKEILRLTASDGCAPEHSPEEKVNAGNNFCRTCGCHFPPDDEDKACRAWEECCEAQAAQSATQRSEPPRFIDLGTHQLCRFDNGQWSLRFKMDRDAQHVRYLNEFEAQMLNAALDGAAKREGQDG